jgi:NhaP-type Na+/H+ or K+/H+ antiporter
MLQLYVNEVILAPLLVFLWGPYFAGISDPRSWTPYPDAVTLDFMRIVLVTGFFAIGVELPRGYLVEPTKSLIKMVVLTMAIVRVIVPGE